jgi:hypothetical protein
MTPIFINKQVFLESRRSSSRMLGHNGLFTNCYPFCYLRGILRLNGTNGEMDDARRVQFPDLSGRYRIYQARWFLSSLATEMMSSLFPPRTTAFGSRNLRQERSRWARTGPRRMPILAASGLSAFQRVTRQSRRQSRKGALAATDPFRTFGAAV